MDASNTETEEVANTVPVNHKVTNVVISDMPQNSNFVKPKRMKFTQNSNQRIWDLVDSHDACACLCYHPTKKAFLLVKQFRPPVFYSRTKLKTNSNINKDENEDENENKSELTIKGNVNGHEIGCTYECIAGIIDKPDLSHIEIIKEELMEEIGYDVPLENIQKITEYRSSPGILGSKTIIFYAEINDEMKVGKGGGCENEHECIELIWISLQKSKAFALNPAFDCPPGLKFSFYWFYDTFPQLCKDVEQYTL